MRNLIDEKCIIVAAFIITFVTILLFLSGSTNEVEKQLEDEEQAEWLKEYSERKKNRYENNEIIRYQD